MTSANEPDNLPGETQPAKNSQITKISHPVSRSIFNLAKRKGDKIVFPTSDKWKKFSFKREKSKIFVANNFTFVHTTTATIIYYALKLTTFRYLFILIFNLVKDW